MEVFYSQTFSSVYPWIDDDTRESAIPPVFPWSKKVKSDKPATLPKFPPSDPAFNEAHEVSSATYSLLKKLLASDDKIRIPIYGLSHITHHTEASSICQLDKCIFTSKQKTGKKYGDKPHSFQYSLNETKPVLDVDFVIPGYFSWWGLSTKDWYENEQGKNVEETVNKLDTKKVYVPGYLQSPPSSHYGNTGFVIGFNDIMKYYKNSRTDCESKSIYLKKAGTLRYRYEICYVIIVCMKKDTKSKSLESMPSVYEEDVFEHDGYINEDGKIVDESRLPHFISEHAVFAVYPDVKYYSWENLAFAFYFPDEDHKLLCPRNSVHIIRDVKCRKQKCPDCKKPKSPDQQVDKLANDLKKTKISK